MGKKYTPKTDGWERWLGSIVTPSMGGNTIIVIGEHPPFILSGIAKKNLQFIIEDRLGNIFFCKSFTIDKD